MDMDIELARYIDVKDALARIGGNMDLYKRLLGRFIDGNHFDALDVALQSGNTEEAAHLAHTLKGVSANLSLIEVRTISANLEQAVKGGLDHTAPLAELKDAYDVTVRKIKELIG